MCRIRVLTRMTLNDLANFLLTSAESGVLPGYVDQEDIVVKLKL